MRSACLMRRSAGGEPHHALQSPAEALVVRHDESVVPYSWFMSKSRRITPGPIGIEAAGRLVGERSLAAPRGRASATRCLLAAREIASDSDRAAHRGLPYRVFHWTAFRFRVSASSSGSITFSRAV